LTRPSKALISRGVKDYELIIIDDASDEPLICDRAKVTRVEPKDKWYIILYSFTIWIQQAQGDIVVIQNPECYHVGDILAYRKKISNQELICPLAVYSINMMKQ